MLFGASVGCWLPLAAYNTQWAVNAARRIGCDFVQCLPLRGVKCVQYWSCPAGLIEGAWNTASFTEALNNTARKDAAAATFYDWLFFGPGRLVSRSQDIVYATAGLNAFPYRDVVHDGSNPRTFLEVNAGQFKTVESIRRGMAPGQGLCLDTNHLGKDPRSDQLAKLAKRLNRSLESVIRDYSGSLLGPWRESIPALLEGFDGPVIVHAAPDRDNGEYERILAGERTEFHDKMELILSLCRPLAVVAEALPSKRVQAFNIRQVTRNLDIYMNELRQIAQ